MPRLDVPDDAGKSLNLGQQDCQNILLAERERVYLVYLGHLRRSELRVIITAISPPIDVLLTSIFNVESAAARRPATMHAVAPPISKF